MARGVNKVILVGNLGNDPEAKYSQAGAAITNITIATSESWKDKNTGEAQERTEWHRVVFFNKLAEIAAQYLRKGSKVYIEGSLRTRKWQDQQGNDRYTTEIVANEMQMLDSRGAGQNMNQGSNMGMNSNQPPYGGQPSNPPVNNAPYGGNNNGGYAAPQQQAQPRQQMPQQPVQQQAQQPRQPMQQPVPQQQQAQQQPRQPMQQPAQQAPQQQAPQQQQAAPAFNPFDDEIPF